MGPVTAKLGEKTLWRVVARIEEFEGDSYPPSVSDDPNRARHAESGHPVENVGSELCLSALIGQSTGAETPAQ